MTVANFIIAGTEKAGTTSVYSYLAQHPQVAASRRKETNFFRSETFRGGAEALSRYAACFPDAPGVPVVMEASPGYLGEAELVVPRMRALVPHAKLLFILREPVSRFLSSYHFHRAKLNLPAELTFSDYFEACLAYAGSADGDEPRGDIGEWFLKVLPFGCYSRYLRHYFEAFPRRQISVTFYDDLQADPRAFMERLSGFLDIDVSCWANADFEPVNVTFSGRSRLLHRLAVLANDRLEPVLRPRPRLKSAVVRGYKWLNRARDGYDGMGAEERALLESFYAPWNRDLEAVLGRPLPPGWAGGEGTREADWRTQRGRMAAP